MKSNTEATDSSRQICSCLTQGDTPQKECKASPRAETSRNSRNRQICKTWIK